MANTKSAQKNNRKTIARTLRNRSRKTRLKTLAKKVQTLAEAGDKEAAAVALKAAQPEMARGVARGVLHERCSC